MICGICAAEERAEAAAAAAQAYDDDTVVLDLCQAGTIQAILHALWDIPGVMDQVDAYMRGYGFDDPQEDIDEVAALLLGE